METPIGSAGAERMLAMLKEEFELVEVHHLPTDDTHAPAYPRKLQRRQQHAGLDRSERSTC